MNIEFLFHVQNSEPANRISRCLGLLEDRGYFIVRTKQEAQIILLLLFLFQWWADCGPRMCQIGVSLLCKPSYGLRYKKTNSMTMVSLLSILSGTGYLEGCGFKTAAEIHAPTPHVMESFFTGRDEDQLF
jgi:hypothetical protein